MRETDSKVATENDRQANIMTSLGTTPDNTSCDAELELLRQQSLAKLRALEVSDPESISVHGR